MKVSIQLKSIIAVLLFFYMSEFAFAQTKFPVSLPFQKVNNYFVLHSIPSGKTKLLKITSQKEFDAYFGMATTMGEEGKPTSIDFNTHFVLAIIYSYTNQLVDLVPVNVNQTAKKKAQFQYRFKSNGTQTAILRPTVMIMLKKDYKKIDFELQQVK